MADTTLTELAKELRDVAQQLVDCSDAIIKTHTEMGKQLQSAVGSDAAASNNEVVPPVIAKDDTASDLTGKQGG